MFHNKKEIELADTVPESARCNRYLLGKPELGRAGSVDQVLVSSPISKSTKRLQVKRTRSEYV